MADRIMVKTGHRQCALRNDPPPSPATAPTGRLLRASVCGTDLQILQGKRADRARILGHEGLTAWDDGTGPRAAVFNPVDPSDQDHILGHSYDGIFRDRVTYPAAGKGGPHLVDTALDMPADLAPITEPLGTVLYAWDLVGKPSSIGIWGAGATAALHTLVAVTRGVQAVVVHPSNTRLRWLLERLPSAAGSGLVRTATSPSDAPALDAAFLCVPRDVMFTALSEALEAVRADGCVDLFGGIPRTPPHPQIPGVDLPAIRRANVCGTPSPGHRFAVTGPRGKAVELTGHRGTGTGHLKRAQRLLTAEASLFAETVTDVVSLDTACEMLNALANRRPVKDERTSLKIVIDFHLAAGARRPLEPTATVADITPERIT